MAQTANTYTFAASTGASLDPMVSAVTLVGGGCIDDGASAVTPIGFTFTYEGVAYTDFSANSNGVMRLGTTAVGTAYSNIGTFGSASLAPLWDDHCTGATGVTYVLTGSPGSYVLVVQWDLAISFGSATFFQAWLYEADGVIEYRYGSPDVNPGSATIALVGANTANLQSVTPPSSVAVGTRNDNVATWPGAGQMYQWTPPAPAACVTPIAVSAPQTSTSTDVSWTCASCTGTYYVEYGPTGFVPGTGATAGGGTVIPGATSPTTISGLSSTSVTDIYVRQDCGGSGFSTNSAVERFIPGDVCGNAIDLATLTSPLTSTTVGANDNFTNTCAFGNTDPDLVYYIDVPAFGTLSIGQTSNLYDSENTLFYGGTCPGTTQIACYDDPDIQTATWVNSTGSTQRVYWVQDGYFSGNSGSFTLAWTLTLPPSCPTPANLAVTNVTFDTADLTFTGSGATSYNWEVRSSGAAGSGPVGLLASGISAGSPINVTGLPNSTTMNAYIQAECPGPDFGPWSSAVNFSTLTPGQIGNGTATTPLLPIYTCYGYNYSQQIYLASEYNTPANTYITKIRFFYDNGGTVTANWQDWVVYMGNTTKTSFTSTTDWEPIGSLTQVYSGVVTPVAGQWMEITLNTPFTWNGIDNILVAVDENTPNYSCTAAWRSYTASGNRGILYYSDGTNPDPSAPPAANYGPVNTLSQIQIVGTAPVACSTPVPGNTQASAGSVCAGNSFTLTIQNQPVGIGNTFQWQTSPDGIAPYGDILGATASTYTTTMSGSAYYQCNVTCSTGPVTVASTPVQVLQAPGINCYCVPVTSAGCTDGDVIARVTLNTLDNNSGTGCPSGIGGNGYSDYTATAPAPPNTYTTTLQAGTSYGCTVYAGQYPEGYA
ncbi:MAG: hypothetical protein IT229_02660, partial [Flavobacteriales bacterium]|nr:hypothetical protein [Flavobacteriales bacterium]